MIRPCLSEFRGYPYSVLVEYVILSYAGNRSFANTIVRFRGSSEYRTKKAAEKIPTQKRT